MTEVIQIVASGAPRTPVQVQQVLAAPPQVVEVVEPGDPGPRGLQGVPGPPGPPDTVAEEEIAEHLTDPTPHPAYDDQVDLALIFENHLI